MEFEFHKILDSRTQNADTPSAELLFFEPSSIV